MQIQLWTDDGEELLDDIKIESQDINFDALKSNALIVTDFVNQLVNKIELACKAGYK